MFAYLCFILLFFSKSSESHSAGTSESKMKGMGSESAIGGAKMGLKKKVEQMTLEEKIGQKIMLDFRHWDPKGKSQKDMVAPDDTVAKVIKDNHIGGVILFGNNLKEKSQIKNLTAWYASMKTSGDIRLLIGTDNEGGSVVRLPRSDYNSFPGNMALAAAIAGGANPDIAFEQGRQMANDLLSVQINTNFAPVVDVNDNPHNPVINIRAFSDDVGIVSCLAERVSTGMRQQGLITTYKHFPGHGSTSTDSHSSLPVVNRARAEAFAIDIAPYKYAIDRDAAPDMIMTAHIQYPALDDSKIGNRRGRSIIAPATMSREIQTVILRNQLNFSGVTITDALDMGAIVKHFSPDDAIERVFGAGVDIALMPISIKYPSDVNLLPELINRLTDKVRTGVVSEAEINASVERILILKQRHDLWDNSHGSLSQPSCNHAALEKRIADGSITVVINKNETLPLKNKTDNYFILTPWEQQAYGIAEVMKKECFENVTAVKETELDDEQIKSRIRACDVFMLGTLSTRLSPAEGEGAPSNIKQGYVSENVRFDWLRYAAKLKKKTVHLSLHIPTDIARYAEYVDAAVAVYSYYDYDSGVWRGQSMVSLGEIMTGELKPQGKLPMNIWHNCDSQKNTGTIAFARGFGLSW